MDKDFEAGSGGDHDSTSVSTDIDEVVHEGGCLNTPMGSDNQNCPQNVTPSDTNRTTETGVGSNQVSNVEPPKVGMIFKGWKEVETYYKAYAEQKGFGVTRAQGVYSKGEVRDRIATTWRCECWGRPDMRAMREAKKRSKSMGVSGTGGVVDGVVCADELSNRKRKSKKCECKAKIYAGMNRDGEWVIRTVELEHTNHTPNPADAKLVKEYRIKKLTSNVRRKLLKFFDKGVPVSQIHGCLATEIEGEDDLQYSVKDLAHVVYKARKLKMAGGDAAAMMSCFKQMQEGNQHFYHAHRLDSLGRLKDVLWVDARSRAAYEEFGDVVCFDATYLTNEYELPFVNFVGVNHHGQSILLGCALVSRENSDTFAWIFKEWLSCMNNRPPAAILTDQAAAMRKPIEDVMPSARHRWCIWHIMRKIPEKLGKCEGYHYFKGVLKKVVYESLNEEEFERRWNDLLVDYNLENNDWLKGLYKERHMWVPAYMMDYFWAGMKTTQRVESINSFFDGFVNRHTKLYEFPVKYAQALEKRVRDETAADANCGKYVRRLATAFPVERFFQQLYTDTKFQEVQTECTRMMYCYCTVDKMLDENTIQYTVEDRVWVVPEGQSEEIVTDRRRYYSASFNMETNEVYCDCRRFVTHGIMCKHMMRILDQNAVVDIPGKYIVKRWRKDILRKHTKVRISYLDPNENVVLKRYYRLMSEFETLCDEAAMVNDDAVDLVSKALSSLRTEVENCKITKADECTILSFADDVTQTQDGVDQVNDCDPSPSQFDTIIQDPVVTKKPRGRPKGSRLKTLAEMGFKKPVVRKRNRVVVNDDSGNDKGEDTAKVKKKHASTADKTSTKGISKNPKNKGVDTKSTDVNKKKPAKKTGGNASSNGTTKKQPPKKRIGNASSKGTTNVIIKASKKSVGKLSTKGTTKDFTSENGGHANVTNVSTKPPAKKRVIGKNVQKDNNTGNGLVRTANIDHSLKKPMKHTKVVPKVKLITELVRQSNSEGKTRIKRKRTSGNMSADQHSKASRVG